VTWLLTTLQQFLLFSGAVLVTGCVAWRIFVAPHADRGVHGPAAAALQTAEHRVARLAFAAALVVVLGWGLRGVVQLLGFRDPFVPLREDIELLLFQTFWGTVWMAQGVVVVALAAFLAMALRSVTTSTLDRPPASGRIAGRLTEAALILALAATLAGSGHAVGVDSGRALALVADGLHALAAGCWIGTLAVILTAGRPVEASEETITLFAAQLRRFSPLALVSGATLVSMGVALSWTHVPEVADLWRTTYGRVLASKAGLALVVFGLGFVNWRRGLPVLDTRQGAVEVRRRAAAEVALATGVLLLTAILVHSPKP
jgi:putative copper export protein